VKKEYASIQIDCTMLIPETALFNLCCVDVGVISPSRAKLRLISIYRPPGTDVMSAIDAEALCECLRVLARDRLSLILAGDLNLPKMDWELSLGPSDGVHDTIMNFCLELNLEQLIRKPTRDKNILDVFLTNDPQIVMDYSIDLPLGASDHNSVLIYFNPVSIGLVKPCKKQMKSKIIWDQNSINGAINCLNQIDWRQVLDPQLHPENIWLSFKNILLSVIDHFSQKIKQRVTSHQAGMSYKLRREIKRLSAKKLNIWRSLKNSKGVDFTMKNNKYKAIDALIASKSLHSRLEFESKLITTENVGKFYKYANGKISSGTKAFTLKSDNGNLVSDPLLKSEMFSKFFTECFTTDNELPLAVERLPVTTSEISCILFPMDAVLSNLLKLSNSQTITPDGFSSATLKLFSSALVAPLSLLFELLFMYQYVPSDWKRSFVIPVHKNGPCSNPSNYRPISITSIICRTMERVIKDQLVSYLTKSNLICMEQHGFSKGKSTLTNLLESTSDWHWNIESHSSVDVIYLDLSKAFDSVVHTKLMFKLKQYGIRDNLYVWIEQFLTGRLQSVKVDDQLSRETAVVSGVPQGSVLGPVLFLLYINDLPTYIKSAAVFSTQIIKLFADDIKMYASINSLHDAHILQSVLDCINNWCNIWQLKINVQKSNVFHLGTHNSKYNYSLNGSYITCSPVVTDLGFLVDEKLKFDGHVAQIVSKARSRCAIYLKNFVTREPLLMKTFFKLYVRPILEYGSVIWSPGTHEGINLVEGVQRYFTNKIRICKSLPYARRLEILEMESLHFRRELNDLMFLFKILVGLVNINLDTHLIYKEPGPTRGHSLKLVKPLFQKDNTKNSFLFRIVECWNSLPLEALEARSINSFRLIAQGFLSDNFKDSN